MVELSGCRVIRICKRLNMHLAIPHIHPNDCCSSSLQKAVCKTSCGYSGVKNPLPLDIYLEVIQSCLQLLSSPVHARFSKPPEASPTMLHESRAPCATMLLEAMCEVMDLMSRVDLKGYAACGECLYYRYILTYLQCCSNYLEKHKPVSMFEIGHNPV